MAKRVFFPSGLTEALEGGIHQLREDLLKTAGNSFCVVGIDLAGVPHRPSGMCLLEGFKASTSLLYSDAGILSYVQKENPGLVVIDAPLTLPPGRKSIAERTGVHFRRCDEELRKMKIPFFPITLGPMRCLTDRGIGLRRSLQERGFRVHEIYPGGAQDVWGIPRAKRGLERLRKGLQSLGLKGLKKGITAHELDAATGALVGLYFLYGQARILGDFRSGAILMPVDAKSRGSWRNSRGHKKPWGKEKIKEAGKER